MACLSYMSYFDYPTLPHFRYFKHFYVPVQNGKNCTQTDKFKASHPKKNHRKGRKTYRSGHESLMMTIEQKRVKNGGKRRVPQSGEVRFADFEGGGALLQ